MTSASRCTRGMCRRRRRSPRIRRRGTAKTAAAATAIRPRRRCTSVGSTSFRRRVLLGVWRLGTPPRGLHGHARGWLVGARPYATPYLRRAIHLLPLRTSWRRGRTGVAVATARRRKPVRLPSGHGRFSPYMGRLDSPYDSTSRTPSSRPRVLRRNVTCAVTDR